MRASPSSRWLCLPLQNILLDRLGRAKIADVGLAKLGQDQEPSQTGYVGTLAWAGEHSTPEAFAQDGGGDALLR
jgi:hypothetical protein